MASSLDKIISPDFGYILTKDSHIPKSELENSNSNFALKKADSLLFTGPAGTNVNDILILLLGND
ncbi:hypothetical protein [Leptospira idonii]|uniref:MOFRL domain-containing protein n=1 Tax=Leptospira idonii TaxID=1193500 RepID=A0A4R9M013_9LEPT|nr:hypothetical protein [Leptospira idonii]TGN19983.1 hypothetical protein EHS15_06295 [Leptospira idonii]